MKFSCESCSAQYQIGDEKLGARGVKVRCKRCGHMIVLRPPEPAPAEAGLGDFGLSREFEALGFEGATRGGGSLAAVPDAPGLEDDDMMRTQVIAAPGGAGRPERGPPPEDATGGSPEARAPRASERANLGEEVTMAVDADRAAASARAAELSALAAVDEDGPDDEVSVRGPRTVVEAAPSISGFSADLPSDETGLSDPGEIDEPLDEAPGAFPSLDEDEPGPPAEGDEAWTLGDDGWSPDEAARPSAPAEGDKAWTLGDDGWSPGGAARPFAPAEDAPPPMKLDEEDAKRALEEAPEPGARASGEAAPAREPAVSVPAESTLDLELDDVVPARVEAPLPEETDPARVEAARVEAAGPARVEAARVEAAGPARVEAALADEPDPAHLEAARVEAAGPARVEAAGPARVEAALADEPDPARVEAPLADEPGPVRVEAPLADEPGPVRVEAPLADEPDSARVEAPLADEPDPEDPGPVRVGGPLADEPDPIRVEAPLADDADPARVEAAVPGPVRAGVPLADHADPARVEAANPGAVRFGAPFADEPDPARVEAAATPARVEAPLADEPARVEAADPGPVRVEAPLAHEAARVDAAATPARVEAPLADEPGPLGVGDPRPVRVEAPLADEPDPLGVGDPRPVRVEAPLADEPDLVVGGGSAEPGPDPAAHAADPDASVEDEIGSAFAAMFTGDDAPPEGAAGSTPGAAAAAEVPLSSEAPLELREEAPPELPKEAEAPAATLAAEWYVAIHDEQVGPLTRREVEAKWASGTLSAESLCWRQGMTDWTPIGDVEALAELRRAPSARPRAPSSAFGVAAQQLTGEVAPAIVLGEEPRSGRGFGAEGGPRDGATGSSAAPADELGWRPSAASALASLAAEELEAPGPSPGASKPTTGKMTALPTASGELSKLIEGSGRSERTASMFGLGEQSVSKVRAIPKRSETLASPLADPEPPRSRKKPVLVAAAALAGLLVAGVAGATLFGEGDDAEPPKQAETAGTSGSGTARGVESSPSSAEEGALAAAKAPAAERAASTPEPEKAEPEKAEPEKAEPEAPGAEPERASASPGSPEGKALVAAAEAPSSEAPRAEAAPPAPPEAPPSVAPEPKVEKPERRKTKRRASRPARRAPRRAAARPAPKPEPKPEPPPRRESGSGSVDDLLSAAGSSAPRRRRAPPPEPKLPEKLDQTEVFKVLRRHKAQVRDCIDKHQRSGGPRGRVKVTLTIQPTGRVSGTELSPGAFGRAVLGRCLSSNARTWKFPRFSGDATPVAFPVTVK